MSTLSLRCENCSAPLTVPEHAKYVTCSHCGTQLAVKRSGAAVYTETLEAIDQRTERMAKQIEELHKQNAVEALDRQWQQDRQQYYVTGKHGHRSLPTTTGSVVGGVVMTLFGAFWTMMACGIGGGFAMNAPAPFNFIGGIFPLFGLLFIGLGAFSAYSAYHKAERYQKAERRYQQRRAELQRQSERGSSFPDTGDHDGGPRYETSRNSGSDAAGLFAGAAALPFLFGDHHPWSSGDASQNHWPADAHTGSSDSSGFPDSESGPSDSDAGPGSFGSDSFGGDSSDSGGFDAGFDSGGFDGGSFDGTD